MSKEPQSINDILEDLIFEGVEPILDKDAPIEYDIIKFEETKDLLYQTILEEVKNSDMSFNRQGESYIYFDDFKELLGKLFSKAEEPKDNTGKE